MRTAIHISYQLRHIEIRTSLHTMEEMTMRRQEFFLVPRFPQSKGFPQEGNLQSASIFYTR